ncbi:hypothetical protein GOV10_05760 [Candidatus Woesearchaeota archaeon]|nr:hypothetical protein [Candidatus Woesearchaeota archaeon]
MTKIACIGYRPWGKRIFSNLVQADLGDDIEFLHHVTPERYSADSGVAGLEKHVLDMKNKSLLKEYLDEHKPDLALCYSWSYMIPEDVVDNYFCVCLHPSMLPKYRGGSPIQNQMMAGEDKGGVTLFKMAAGMDDGNILKQQEMSLLGNLSEVLCRMANIGTDLSLEMINEYNKGTLVEYAQNHDEATYCKRKKKAESKIEQEDMATSRILHDKIRSLQDPYPNAYVESDSGRLYVQRSHILTAKPEDMFDLTSIIETGIGELPKKDYYYVGTGDGGVLISQARYKENTD